MQNWLLSTLSVNNIISESLSMQKRILLQSAPAEDGYLRMVIEAMKRSVRIAVDYRKYGTDNPRHFNFEPYCLKLFKQRWYILGHFHRDATEEIPETDYFGIFSFDRILNMELTDIKFRMDPDFDAQEYFDECYGVLVGDDTMAERIVIRVYDYLHRRLVKTLLGARHIAHFRINRPSLSIRQILLPRTAQHALRQICKVGTDGMHGIIAQRLVVTMIVSQSGCCCRYALTL